MSCYTEESCAGDMAMMTSRECCVDDPDGMSFSSDGECFNCIGILDYFSLVCHDSITSS